MPPGSLSPPPYTLEEFSIPESSGSGRDATPCTIQNQIPPKCFFQINVVVICSLFTSERAVRGLHVTT